MTDAALACRNVWKLYGPDPKGLLARLGSAPGAAELKDAGYITAVADATLDVARGEIFVIMGLSGSGKSTLVRCLARLIEPSAGEVIFAGRNLLDASRQELIELRRHKMGMVFQHFALLPHLTVLDNVAFPLEIQGVTRKAREARALEMTALVGLKGRERNLPHELSGGQQQRVGIARSLATDPDIWFLDEPFSALDPLIRREMQNEFLRLQSVLQKTIVFITHDFDEAIRLADRIAIMQDGRIVQIGTPEDLVLAPAEAYVAEFTRDAPRAKILSARAIARARRNGEDIAGSIPADSKVAEFAKKVEAASARFRRARCRRQARWRRRSRGGDVGAYWRHGSMTTAATTWDETAAGRRFSAVRLIWIAFAALAVLCFALPDGTIPGWLLEIPPGWRLGLAPAISSFMNWLIDDASFGLFTFREATRAISATLNVPLTAATAIFSTGALRGSGSTAVQLAPPLPWIAIVGIAAALGYRFGGIRLALLAGGAFLYLAVFGQWASAMTTLASIAIAVPLGVAGGILFGILGFRVPLARQIMEPILDLMQTVPIFAYLVPILFLFGFGPVAALIATVIYAMPPMVRVTMTALEAVPREIVEYGTMAGTTRQQMLFKVMLPAARPQLLVGVNQVIMLSLNMVIIASMIGAGGLGYDVLAALRRLDIGAGFEAGLAIVVLAIALDRLSQAYASRRAAGHDQDRTFVLALLAFTAAIYVLGLFVPAVAIYPRRCSSRPRRGGARRSDGSTCISSTRWTRSRPRSSSTSSSRSSASCWPSPGRCSRPRSRLPAGVSGERASPFSPRR